MGADPDRDARRDLARIPESDETEPADEAAPAGAGIFVETGCGSCHTLEAAGTDGTAGPNLDEAAADESAEEIRAAIGDHPDDFESQLSEEDLATLASFVAENASN
jgi:mono/diheme cytochrome c family protein